MLPYNYFPLPESGCATVFLNADNQIVHQNQKLSEATQPWESTSLFV